VGLPWFIHHTWDEQTAVSTDGTTFGYSSYCLQYPALHFGVIILTNEGPSGPNSSLENDLSAMAQSIYDASFYSPAERGSDTFGLPPSIRLLLSVLTQQGFAQAIPVVDSLRSHQVSFHLTEDETNNWGYALLGKGRKSDALEIFKLNVHLHPQSWNAYDSEAEAYADNGDKENAILNYKRSLELNPGNTNAVEQLKKLE
jgi:serine-type D-Ala-D-Ala carboxypeptidase/endopeptidase